MDLLGGLGVPAGGATLVCCAARAPRRFFFMIYVLMLCAALPVGHISRCGHSCLLRTDKILLVPELVFTLRAS